MDRAGSLHGAPLRVSVVVPSYNYARHLAEAVESVLASTLPVRELIIVDDGSTDNSVEVARGLIEAHPNSPIELICQPNSGAPAAARNTGIARTTADYIVCLDADDILSPGYLQACAAALHANPRAGIAYSCIQRFGEEDTLGQPPEWNSRSELDSNFIGSASMFRRAAWEQVGGYDPSKPLVGYEDWDFWVSCIDHGWEGINVPGALWYYRVHRTGVYATNVARDQLLKAHIVAKHPSVYNAGQRRWAAGVLAGEAHALSAGTTTGAIPTVYSAPDEPPRGGKPLPVRKVCLIARDYPPSSRSGGSRAAHMQAQLLRSAGVEVHVLTQAGGTRVGSREEAAVIVHSVPVPELNVPSALSYITMGLWSYQVAEAFATLDPHLRFELVDASGCAADLLHLAPRPETPLITSLHGIDTSREDPGHALELTGLKRADLLLSPTEGAVDAITERLGKTLPATEVMSVPFDPEMFPERRTRERQPGPIRALYFGRLEAGKRPELALHALAAARGSGLECELTVVGHDVDGYTEQVLAPLQRRLGLRDIEYVPHIDDLFSLRALVQRADVAILPLSSPGAPLAILESLSSGVPVITSDRVGLSEVIGLDTGLAAVPIDDALEFAARAAELMADAGWMSTGPRAAAWIRATFDREAVVERLLDCYRRLLAERRPDARSGHAAAELPFTPIDGARRVAVLALAEEIVDEPALLQAWARTVDGSDDITLVILTPDWSAEVVARELGPVVAQAGLDADDAADLLALTTPASPEAHARLAAGATAILSRRHLAGPFGALRRVDEHSVAGLHAGLALEQAA